VRAAADARELLDQAAAQLASVWEVQVTLSTGIHTGEAVIAVAEGRPLKLVGAPARLAGQLEQAAVPGEILLDTATCGLVRDAVRVEPDPPLVLRGRGEPVAAWRLVSVRPGAPGRAWRLDAPMVGRSRQLAQLTGAFEAAVADQACQLFTILGPAGVGKSRLAHEFLTTVGERATVLRGRCLDYGQGITYWPIAEVIRQAAGASDTDAPAEVLSKLRALVAGEEDAELVAERVAALLGLAEASGAAEEFFWAVRKLLEVLGRRRPLVVVLDDLHWAEASLLDLVEHVADWSRDAPILLCCLARSELLDVRPGWAGGKWNATSILLEPLSRDDCMALVDHLLGGLAGAEDARAQITQAAEGNPLYVEELVAMLIDDRVLARRNGHWVTTRDLAVAPVPPTVQTLLAARLDRLAPSEQQVIQRASVVGQVFYAGAVTELTPEPDRSELAAHLMQLTRKQLIRPDRSSFAGEATFRFRHLLIRDAAYQALPKRERAILHGQFAGWLERVAGERLTEHEEILGFHLEQAYRYRAELGPVSEHEQELARLASRRLAAAGRRAFARGDMPAAASLLRRASSLLPSTDRRRLELLGDLGLALLMSGALKEADAVLSTARAAAQAAGDDRLRWRATIEQLWVQQLEQPGQRPIQEVREEVQQAVAALTELEDHAGLARAWQLLGFVETSADQLAAWVQAAERALEHARRAGDPYQETTTLLWLAAALVFGPTPVTEAIRRCEELLRQARGDRRREAFLLRCLAILHASAGHFTKAEELLTQARAIAEDMGLRWLMALFAWSAGDNAALAGDLAVAERELRSASELLTRMGDMSHFPTAVADLADVLYRQGSYEEARRLTEKSQATAAPHDLTSQIRWRGTRAKLLAQSGLVEQAEQLAREAVALAEGTQFLDGHGDVLLDLGEVLRVAGRPNDAVPVVQAALELYNQKGNVVSAARARAALAELQANPHAAQPRPI
jgi:predicted ATPase